MTYVSCFYHAFSGAQKVSQGGRSPCCCGFRSTLSVTTDVTTVGPHELEISDWALGLAILTLGNASYCLTAAEPVSGPTDRLAFEHLAGWVVTSQYTEVETHHPR